MMDVWSHGAPLATVGGYSERAGLVLTPVLQSTV